jgi:hypothetical protein
VAEVALITTAQIPVALVVVAVLHLHIEMAFMLAAAQPAERQELLGRDLLAAVDRQILLILPSQAVVAVPQKLEMLIKMDMVVTAQRRLFLGHL